MRIEVVLLTGGASRRMGEDKASILIEGVPQAQRIARAFSGRGIPVTVLGREPIDGLGFLADAEEFSGPLQALARFKPTGDAVFVCSCDLPLFDHRILDLLSGAIKEHAAAAPKVNSFRQPLCALYRSIAFSAIPGVLAQEGACAMRWLDTLDHTLVTEDQVSAAGLNPQCAQGANTREAFDRMLRQAPDVSARES